MARWPHLLRRARQRAGRSQRDLAARAGTSSATLSTYETARKAPRADTLERILAAAGEELDSMPARTVRERRTDFICEALAERVLADPGVLVAARERLGVLRRVHDDGSASRWITAWEHLLDAGAEAVAAVLTSPLPAARPLKSTTPIAGIGLLDEATRAKLAAAARAATTEGEVAR